MSEHPVNEMPTSYICELVRKLGLSTKMTFETIYEHAHFVWYDKEATPEEQTTAAVICGQISRWYPTCVPEELR